MHIWLTTNSVAEAMTGSLQKQFQKCLMRRESAILCALNFKYPNLLMPEVQLTKSTECLRSFSHVNFVNTQHNLFITNGY